MRRNSSRHGRNNSHYNVALLDDFRTKAGLTVRGVAVKARLNGDTIQRVFKGTASYKQVRRVAKFFKIDWTMLHDLDLPPDQFHRAVLNGDSRSVR